MDTGTLRPLERQLAQAVGSGRELVCSDLDPAVLAVSKDERYQIRAEAIRDILLGRHVEHPHPQGLRVSHARIIGSLNLDRLAPIMGIELSLCAADNAITMRGARAPWLLLNGTYLPALAMDGSYVEGAVELIRLRVDADSKAGALQLTGAYIHGVLDCSGTTLANNSGPALTADDLKVDGSVNLSGIRASSNCESGTVQLSHALISGGLSCDHTSFTNKSGPALVANNLKVNSSALLNSSQHQGNHPTHATVQFNGVHVGRNLELNGSVLSNASGPALTAHGIQIDDTASFRNKFHAAGRVQATVSLEAARISGGLDFTNSQMLSPNGLALDLAAASATWLCLPGDAICQSGTDEDPRSWKGNGQLRLDGFNYSALDPRGAGLDQWLRWLRYRTPSYATQPYQQLAAVHRATGDEAGARRVLIAQQDDLLARGELGGAWPRAWHRLKGITVGYGYQTWRALIGLAIVVLLAITLGLVAGHIPTSSGRFEAARISPTRHPGTPCSTIEQVGLGLDLSLPAINTGVNTLCQLNSTTNTGQILIVIGWLLQGIAWALATLVVVGYTGLIRKI